MAQEAPVQKFSDDDRPFFKGLEQKVKHLALEMEVDENKLVADVEKILSKGGGGTHGKVTKFLQSHDHIADAEEVDRDFDQGLWIGAQKAVKAYGKNEDYALAVKKIAASIGKSYKKDNWDVVTRGNLGPNFAYLRREDQPPGVYAELHKHLSRSRKKEVQDVAKDSLKHLEFVAHKAALQTRQNHNDGLVYDTIENMRGALQPFGAHEPLDEMYLTNPKDNFKEAKKEFDRLLEPIPLEERQKMNKYARLVHRRLGRGGNYMGWLAAWKAHNVKHPGFKTHHIEAWVNSIPVVRRN